MSLQVPASMLERAEAEILELRKELEDMAYEKERQYASAQHWAKAYDKLAEEMDESWTACGEENRKLRAFMRLPSVILRLKGKPPADEPSPA
jgi:hypothetical protein